MAKSLDFTTRHSVILGKGTLMSRLRVLFAYIGLTGASLLANAETIHVPTDYPTIQEAINAAGNGDTVILSPGFYFEPINFAGKAITVESENPDDPDVVSATYINAPGSWGVFCSGSESSASIVSGLTFSGGYAGVYAQNSAVSIRNCVIQHNQLGISKSSGSVENCTFIYNNVGLSECNGSISDSRIMHNDIGISGGTLAILRSRISSNPQWGIADHRGLIDSSFVLGNDAGVVFGEGVIRNSIIAGNTYGIWNSNYTILGCTITQNYGGFTGHRAPISNCIIWKNAGYNYSDSTIVPTFSGSVDPHFVMEGRRSELGEWVDWDYHLLNTSPYIDAGDPNYPSNLNATSLDIEGNPRVIGSRVDIGAYEFQTSCIGPDFDGDGTPDPCDRDIDGDGVPNVIDVCEDTPEGIPITPDGRPVFDSNHDCRVDLFDFAAFQKSMTGP